MSTFSKLLILVFLCLSYAVCSALFYNWSTDQTGDEAMRQLENPAATRSLRDAQLVRSNVYFATYLAGWAVLACTGFALFAKDAKAVARRMFGMTAAVLLLCSTSGCWKPYEPNHLEIINPNEEGFLLPFTTAPETQSQTNTEEYLKRNLVFTQQVRIPQQWVSKGYETVFWNGEWQAAAMLVKVDKSPVTREWTADPNSGTSTRNEAIWVMTADQVEFSTGWTCTGRIASRDEAVKFLHNYPNGTLEKVMDHEIRAYLQAAFGLEVTDLPMDTLRKNATPHIIAVTKKVKEFFEERGIQITNLGITGGFVYKDDSIIKTLVKVFNAEQDKNVAIAKTAAQEEENKRIMLEAEGKAKALLTERKAEADGIKLVADAKAYEMEKAKQNEKTYLALKQIELQKSKIERWDGKFPQTYMGQQGMDMLLQVPMATAKD